ncbi:MAG TPA: hypothetical protein VMZ28_18440 [Kofleriaceae bacterium]|nr:hypothetical protein [Kofleriaceae bacterium]
MRHVVQLTIWIALLTLCGCEVKVSVGDDNKPMGTFACAALEDDTCAAPTDHFAPTVEVVHVVYRTKTLPKKDEVYTIRWIGEDVGQVAPPNTVIATLDEKVTDNPAVATSYSVHTHLTKPTAGWPVGKYRVEIERAGTIETTARFSIAP